MPKVTKINPLELQVRELRRALNELIRLSTKTIPSSKMTKLALPEQPFDALLLKQSPLFRKSRELYQSGGGEYRVTLVSSPRTLSSPILMEQMIEYTPIERELIWSCTDPLERKNSQHLLLLRSFVSSLFHEQNHRILWRHLPPLALPSRNSAEATRRYLNFAESLVIALDIALGDSLGFPLAKSSYLVGVTYDPGTDTRKTLRSRRQYRNYLQAALYATYLKLEHYDARDITRLIDATFSGLGPFANRAAQRTDRLSLAFVTNTNPIWQRRFGELAAEKLSTLPASKDRFLQEPLLLPENPVDSRLLYLIGERVFSHYGL